MRPFSSDSGNQDVTVTKTLAPQARRNELLSYGDDRLYDYGQVAGDQLQPLAHPDNSSSDTTHVYSGDDHPVVVTDTGSHAFASADGDEIVVGDVSGDLSDEVAHELGELGSWIDGASFFLDSKHDLDAAWNANRLLLQ